MKRWIIFSFYACILGFIFVYIQRLDFSKIDGIVFNYGWLAFASILGIVFRYWGAFVWMQILKGLGHKKIDNVQEMNFVYAQSWLGRYIPGKVVWIAGKVYLASQYGISKSKLAVSSILEGMLQVIVITNLSLLFLSFSNRIEVVSSNVRLALIFFALGISLLLIPKVFNYLLFFAFRLFKKEFSNDDNIDFSVILRGCALYGFGSLLTGLSYFFLVSSFVDVKFGMAPFIMGTFNLAGAIGMISMISPSGIGVREGVQFLLLGFVMHPEMALVVTIVARIWSLLIDLLFFIITYTVKKYI